MSSGHQTVLDRFYNEFQDLPMQNPEEFYKLIKTMYVSDKNINMKTDIKNPPLHSVLDLSGEYLKDCGMKDGSKYVKSYSLSLKEQMVSDNRKGRGEFTQLMSAKMQQLVRSIGERLTGKHQDNE